MIYLKGDTYNPLLFSTSFAIFNILNLCMVNPPSAPGSNIFVVSVHVLIILLCACVGGEGLWFTYIGR